jgi:hypothetical protein
MQEILLADTLSWDYLPSVGYLKTLVGTLTAKSDELYPRFQERFGGRPLDDSEILYLAS